MDYKTILEQQRKFFESNKTKDLHFRINILKNLKTVLKNNENLLYEAIYADFKKSDFETYATEIGILYNDINLAIRKIRSWSPVSYTHLTLPTIYSV